MKSKSNLCALLLLTLVGLSWEFKLSDYAHRNRNQDKGKKVYMDLTHSLDASMPVYPVYRDFISQKCLAQSDPPMFFTSNCFLMAEHVGTHIEVKRHAVPDSSHTIDVVAIERLMDKPAVVIDITKKAASDPDYEVNQTDIDAYEHQYGRIPKDAYIMMDAGWTHKIHDKDAYLGRGPDGKFHFPGFHHTTVSWLIDHRKIAALGVDTFSFDRGIAPSNPCHKALLYDHDLIGIEVIGHLHKIPRAGATVSALPMKLTNGTAGPGRVVATWYENSPKKWA